jgi:hypothetical protein
MNVLLIAMVMLGWMAPRAAEACGAWEMTDVERKLQIRWDITSASVSQATGKRARIGAFYLSDERGRPQKVVTSKRVEFDLKPDGKLVWRGKQIGTVDDAASTIALGNETYTLVFGARHDDHLKTWDLTLRRGTIDVLASKNAWALCAGMDHANGKEWPVEQQQAEIRRRIAFYLAWRKFGAS